MNREIHVCSAYVRGDDSKIVAWVWPLSVFATTTLRSNQATEVLATKTGIGKWETSVVIEVASWQLFKVWNRLQNTPLPPSFYCPFTWLIFYWFSTQWHVTFFLYKNQSTRPSHFILHCKQASRQVKKKRKSSKQVSKQASKEERRKEKSSKMCNFNPFWWWHPTRKWSAWFVWNPWQVNPYWHAVTNHVMPNVSANGKRYVTPSLVLSADKSFPSQYLKSLIPNCGKKTPIFFRE